ncbi:MAG: hypothetical protein NC452_18215 [Eubacterium sp.]|nr:hypothetical protein [Eubacterium sp.]
MKRITKRTIASILVAATMAMGIGSLCVSAASQTVDWSARCVNIPGAPGSESKTGYATLKASGETYTGTVTEMSDITNRSLTLSCTTHTMSTGPIVYNNTGTRTWTISGETTVDVTYKMVAYTSLQTVLNVKGTVSR